MKSLIKYEDVMKSPPTITLSSSKQNDVNADPLANVTVAGLPRSV
jgi:hypothetical protein